MKRLFFCCILLLGVWCPYAEAALQFQPADFEISLLTSERGNELYSGFGHSALRVRNDADGYDAVYNYGVFSFDEPNFYINFARGRMNYYLAVQPYDSFVRSYVREHRSVREQVFDLDSLQKDFVIRFLVDNSQPENRYYLYHFFLDNCATRIRDLMLKVYDGLELPREKEQYTYRQLVYQCLQDDYPWGKFGIDIALGLPTDQKTDTYAQMFLPDYLASAFAGARYKGQSIISETRDVFISQEPSVQPPGIITPMLVCCFILALSVLFCFVKKGARVFDFILFLVVGLTGLLVFFLWFFTDHTNTQNNLNIIWALPTHLVMAFFLLRKVRSNFTRKYFLVTSIIAVLFLVCWFFLPQTFNIALIPLVISIALRAYYNSKLVNC